jgi:hypothetical protein
MTDFRSIFQVAKIVVQLTCFAKPYSHHQVDLSMRAALANHTRDSGHDVRVPGVYLTSAFLAFL